jgi:hypothetical protein
MPPKSEPGPGETLSMDRRRLLAGLAAAPVLLRAREALAGDHPLRPGLAVTIDDFNLADTPLMSGAERHAAILAALARRRIRAAGFVAGKYVDNATAPPLLRAWGEAGHLIGNHTYSHPYCPSLTPTAFEAELMRCEAVIGGYPGFRRLFRFPFLAEGGKAQTRDEMREILARRRYRNGQVTIDTSDWYIDQRLTARLKADARADIAPYRAYYLDHIWQRAQFYDGLAGELGLKGVDHTILLHHRLTTGLFLGDLLAMFAERGWRLIDARQAFASPLFARQPDVLPAGQSLIWSLAKADGRFESRLRYPGEDDTYEKGPMDALGL